MSRRWRPHSGGRTDDATPVLGLLLLFLLFNHDPRYTDRVNISVAGSRSPTSCICRRSLLPFGSRRFCGRTCWMMLPGGWPGLGPFRLGRPSSPRWRPRCGRWPADAHRRGGQFRRTMSADPAGARYSARRHPLAPVADLPQRRAVGADPERGTAIAAISAGSSLGAAVGAPFGAWIISVSSWRWSFVVTGEPRGLFTGGGGGGAGLDAGEDQPDPGAGAATHPRRARTAG